jgi:hypothetical protein
MSDQFTRLVDRPLVYLAGPYREPNPVHNTHFTLRHAQDLHYTGLVTCVVPHLSLLWEVVIPCTSEYWLEYDLALLNRCDALYRIPGDSPGADAEVVYAHQVHIPVFTDQDLLLDWARDCRA